MLSRKLNLAEHQNYFTSQSIFLINIGTQDNEQVLENKSNKILQLKSHICACCEMMSCLKDPLKNTLMM